MNIIKEFKEFAVKGNVLDMAIGIIIGTAFNRIVSSLVGDIIMPPFRYLLSGVEYKELRYVLQEKETGEVLAINYGNFIHVTLDFLLISFTIFLVIRFINSLKRKAESEEEKTVPTPKDIQLLAEIRDLLKERKRE